MTVLRWFGIAVLAMLLLANLGGLFYPRHATVVCTISINKPAATIYPYIANPRLCQLWSPWRTKDTTLVIHYSGPDQGKGAGYTWSGNADVGSGSWVITGTTDRRVDAALSVEGMGASTVWMTVDQRGRHSDVAWAISTDMGWLPMLRLFTPLFTSYVTTDFNAGLANLKSLMESLPNSRTGMPELVQLPPTHVLSIRTSVNTAEIGKSLATMYGTIMHEAFKQRAELKGNMPVMAIYYGQRDGARQTDLEAAIITTKPARSASGVHARTIPAGEFVRVPYFGPYEKTSTAYHAAREFARQSGRSLDSAAMEWYVTDPQSVADTSLWQTDVYFRIR